MTLTPVVVEISVEREAPPGENRPGRRVRVTARLEPSSTGILPTPEELHAAMEALTERLDSALALSGTFTVKHVESNRTVDELIQAYRPRQVELVDLLREDGEISIQESERMKAHLERHPENLTRSLSVPPARARGKEEGIPAMPRPVGELIDTYRIESLRQAGAVRARRQISFAEYMSLKRHFSEETKADEARR